MAQEDALVQRHLAGSADPLVRATAQRFVADIRVIFHDYSAHVRAWTPDAIGADWPAYKTAVLHLQHRLRERFAWEERTVHPLLRDAIDAANRARAA